MQAGKMPGGCRGKKNARRIVLMNLILKNAQIFALGAGLMKQEEFEMFKKTGGKDQGDCRGKEQCETFCNNPENQVCALILPKEHNLIPQKKLKK